MNTLELLPPWQRFTAARGAIRIGGLVDADSDLSGFEITKIDVTHFGPIFRWTVLYFQEAQFQRVEKLPFI